MEPEEKILSAAVELFRQYGFKTITMDDIARRAGVSKKTLYQYFANKNDIVTASVAWYKKGLSCCYDEALSKAENAIEGFVYTMSLFDQLSRELNPMAMLELERYYPDGYKHFQEQLLEQDVAIIENNIQRGIKEGLFREEIDAAFMARYRMELSLLSLHPTVFLRNEINYISHEISEHFLYGLMTAKGIRLYKKYKLKYLKQAK